MEFMFGLELAGAGPESEGQSHVKNLIGQF
jgi:hypothetical protein